MVRANVGTYVKDYIILAVTSISRNYERWVQFHFDFANLPIIRLEDFIHLHKFMCILSQ